MKNKDPFISIILPVYNTEKYIYECISSILNQSFQNFELIICDDCSTDKSREIINSFKDKRIIFKHNDRNLGKITTVNNVLSSIKGKYFSVHDADDSSDNNRFVKQIKLMEKNPNLAMCGSSFNEIDENGKFVRYIEMPTDIDQIVKSQSFPDISNFHGPTLLIKTSIIPLVGGFYRNHFVKGEDIEFCSRVCEKYDSTNLNEPLYSYRLLNTSLTKSVDAYDYRNIAHIEFGKYIQKHRREFGNDLYITLNSVDLDELYNKYVSRAKTQQLAYYKYGIDRSIYFKYYKNAYILIFKWIMAKPYDYKAYKYLITITMKLLIRRKND